MGPSSAFFGYIPLCNGSFHESGVHFSGVLVVRAPTLQVYFRIPEFCKFPNGSKIAVLRALEQEEGERRQLLQEFLLFLRPILKTKVPVIEP